MIFLNFTTPINMPRSTHYGNNFYAVYSNKIHRICHFYSNLEYYNFLTIEINPDVVRFCEQPLKIDIMQENSLKSVVFDMWVLYRDGTEELQEIKYSAELEGEDAESLRSQEQIRREGLWCSENGIDFSVRTEKSIDRGRFFLDNANVIAARIRRYISKEDAFYNPRIINALTKYNILSVEELIKNDLLPINHEIDHLCYMYEKGLIEMNINDQPLGDKTEVSLWQN